VLISVVFSFECFAPVKRLPEKIVSEMTYEMSSGVLNPFSALVNLSSFYAYLWTFSRWAL